jgi:hypothetical protein
MHELYAILYICWFVIAPVVAWLSGFPPAPWLNGSGLIGVCILLHNKKHLNKLDCDLVIARLERIGYAILAFNLSLFMIVIVYMALASPGWD